MVGSEGKHEHPHGLAGHLTTLTAVWIFGSKTRPKRLSRLYYCLYNFKGLPGGRHISMATWVQMETSRSCFREHRGWLRTRKNFHTFPDGLWCPITARELRPDDHQSGILCARSGLLECEETPANRCLGLSESQAGQCRALTQNC